MARVVVPGYPHHVTQRGSRRQRTFFSDSDYRYYISLLAEFSSKTGSGIWAYCLMPNHVHLVIVPAHEDGLRATLSQVHRRYTRHVNAREGWRGHLWQERFHSFPMDERHLMTAVRYVENNPVAARLCTRPEQWPWSSARAHLAGQDDDVVATAPMLERVADWQAYLDGDPTTQAETELIRRHSRTGRPLGGDAFIRRLEVLTGRSLMRSKPGPAGNSGDK
jgi:putative transposase